MNDRNKVNAYVFLTASFVAVLFYSYLLSFTERGLPLNDTFNIVLLALLAGLHAWLAYKVSVNKDEASKNIRFFMILILLLTSADIYGFIKQSNSIWLVIVSLLEAAFLFGAYTSVKKIQNANNPK